MRVLVRDDQQQVVGQVGVDVAQMPEQVLCGDREVALKWERTVDDQGHLRRCVVCGCGELFVRKDFPQKLGMALVVVAGLTAVVLWAMQQVFAGLAVLGAVVVLDVLVMFFVGRCLVCYRCRSEYRELPIDDEHKAWNLAVGEKYRSNT